MGVYRRGYDLGGSGRSNHSPAYCLRYFFFVFVGEADLSLGLAAAEAAAAFFEMLSMHAMLCIFNKTTSALSSHV